MALEQKKWNIQPSEKSMSTVNKIRDIVDLLPMDKINKNKKFISISIGDPTKYPNLKPAANAIPAIKKILDNSNHNGYSPSFGFDETRAAVAKKYSYKNNNVDLNDVFMCSGCSDALNIAVCSLLNDNDHILLPRPGFSFYETICGRYNFVPKFYNLLPDKEWEIDTKDLESKIDDKVKCILINNPSNPCGSVLSEKNLRNVIEIANKYKIPIIADEIYSAMVFGNAKFIPLASLTSQVPIICVSGTAKEFLVPGWRLGWIITYDQNKYLGNVKEAMRRLSTVILGPNTLMQGALPSLLFDTPKSYYQNLCSNLENNTNELIQALSKIPELKPIPAKGAMYLMVKIELNKLKNIKNDVEFAQKLLVEESVSILPGVIFGMPNYFRCVTCPPPSIMKEVGQRISEFCARHRKNPSKL